MGVRAWTQTWMVLCLAGLGACAPRFEVADLAAAAELPPSPTRQPLGFLACESDPQRSTGSIGTVALTQAAGRRLRLDLRLPQSPSGCAQLVVRCPIASWPADPADRVLLQAEDSYLLRNGLITDSGERPIHVAASLQAALAQGELVRSLLTRAGESSAVVAGTAEIEVRGLSAPTMTLQLSTCFLQPDPARPGSIALSWELTGLWATILPQ